MSPPGTPHAGVVLAATLAIQITVSLAATATAALAPVMAADLDVPARWVGAFTSLVYAGATAASLLAGAAISRYGAIRVSQACVLVAATGLAGVAATPNASWPLAALAAIVLGLGYGPITPASSHVLARTTPAERRNIVFSIKQTGVPAGAALAGALLPALALAWGWRAALVAVVLVALAVVAAAQPLRVALDADRDAAARITVAQGFASVRRLLRDPAMAPLAWLSFAYAAAQVSLTTFLVVHATSVLGWSLVAAGFALSVATVAGVAGRLAFGWIADHRGTADVLPAIGVLAGGCALALAFAPATWPGIAILAVAALFGATAIGWNGVYLAELARRSPPGMAGAVTGASGVVTFGGVMFGPTVFGLLSALPGGTRTGFAMLAVLISGAAIAYGLWEHRRRATKRSN